ADGGVRRHEGHGAGALHRRRSRHGRGLSRRSRADHQYETGRAPATQHSDAPSLWALDPARVPCRGQRCTNRISAQAPRVNGFLVAGSPCAEQTGLWKLRAAVSMRSHLGTNAKCRNAAVAPLLGYERLHQEVKLTTGEKIKKLRLVARALVDNAI